MKIQEKFFFYGCYGNGGHLRYLVGSFFYSEAFSKVNFKIDICDQEAFV